MISIIGAIISISVLFVVVYLWGQMDGMDRLRSEERKRAERKRAAQGRPQR